MAVEPRTLAGAQLFIGTDLVVDYTQADAAVAAAVELDSLTEVGWIENFGEIGDVAGVQTFTPVSRRRVMKFKTSFDAGESEYILGYVAGDGGLAVLLAAFDSDNDFNFKIVLPDEEGDSGDTPTLLYIAGKVISKPYRLNTVEDVMRRVIRVAWNNRLVEIPAVAA